MEEERKEPSDALTHIYAYDIHVRVVFALSLYIDRTAVSFSGQFGKYYLEFDWIAPKTGLEF